MRPSHAFRRHTAQVRLRYLLDTKMPSSHGVGLDGIHPGAVADWTAERRIEVVRHVALGLRDESFRFTSYREGLASRGRNKPPRVFSIPTIRDRLALLALKATYREILGYSGPEAPQQKMTRITQAVNSGDFAYYLKVDVQDFFGSIRHQVLLDQLAHKISSRPALSATERALRNATVAFGQRSTGLTGDPDGIPLGLPISSQLAELYLADFDASMSQFAKETAYFRYVDDILILCNSPGTHSWQSRKSSICSDCEPIRCRPKASVSLVTSPTDSTI